MILYVFLKTEEVVSQTAWITKYTAIDDNKLQRIHWKLFKWKIIEEADTNGGDNWSGGENGQTFTLLKLIKGFIKFDQFLGKCSQMVDNRIFPKLW